MLIILLSTCSALGPGNGCTGSSVALPAAECAAWTGLFDATGGTAWNICSVNRTDPCACGMNTGWNFCGPPFGQLDHLVYLQLDDVGARGTLPDSIGNLTKVTTFSMAFNELSGTIPTSVGRLSSVQELALEHNILSGTLPRELIALPNLQYLDAELNQLSGTLPSTIAKMSKLKRLDLLGNAFSGLLPLLPWEQYTSGCWLEGISFDCPLPPGALTNCTGDGHHPPSCTAVNDTA